MNYTLDNVASFQGTYASGTTYNQGDIVAYNSSSYVSLINSNTGNEPDTSLSDWALLAAQGPAGATGPTGPGAQYVYSAGSSSVSLSLAAGTYIITAQASNSGSGAIVTASASGYSSVQAALGSFYLEGPGGGENTYGNTFGVYTMDSAGDLTVSLTSGYTPTLVTAVQVS